MYLSQLEKSDGVALVVRFRRLNEVPRTLTVIRINVELEL